MTLFQVLAGLFGLWMMYEVFIYSKKKVISRAEVGLWLSLWFVFIVISLFPNLLLGISHTLKFARVFDLLIVASFIVLTTLIFLSYFAQRENTARLEKLIRELAIKEAKTGSKSKNRD